MRLAVVFPGQGSQAVGMGHDWFEQHEAARVVFEAADSILGFPLSELCFNGPEEELRLTANTQPAILATSWAIYDSIRSELSQPVYFAGHSLGEYTALVAAGSLSLGDALMLVRERGRLMQEAVPVGAGAMAAVIALDRGVLERIVAEVQAELKQPLEVANYNSPDQIVISGAAEAVRVATPRLSAAGAKRVVDLPVSAPFHSSLMQSAATALQPQLEASTFEPTSTTVLANLTAQPYPADPTQYPLLLAAQIYNSVRWTETIEALAEMGATHLLEVGPGKVLRTLTPKISPQIQALNLEKTEQWETVRALLQEASQ